MKALSLILAAVVLPLAACRTSSDGSADASSTNEIRAAIPGDGVLSTDPEFSFIKWEFEDSNEGPEVGYQLFHIPGSGYMLQELSGDEDKLVGPCAALKCTFMINVTENWAEATCDQQTAESSCRLSIHRQGQRAPGQPWRYQMQYSAFQKGSNVPEIINRRDGFLTGALRN